MPDTEVERGFGKSIQHVPRLIAGFADAGFAGGQGQQVNVPQIVAPLFKIALPEAAAITQQKKRIAIEAVTFHEVAGDVDDVMSPFQYLCQIELVEGIVQVTMARPGAIGGRLGDGCQFRLHVGQGLKARPCLADAQCGDVPAGRLGCRSHGFASGHDECAGQAFHQIVLAVEQGRKGKGPDDAAGLDQQFADAVASEVSVNGGQQYIEKGMRCSMRILLRVLNVMDERLGCFLQGFSAYRHMLLGDVCPGDQLNVQAVFGHRISHPGSRCGLSPQPALNLPNGRAVVGDGCFGRGYFWLIERVAAIKLFERLQVLVGSPFKLPDQQGILGCTGVVIQVTV